MSVMAVRMQIKQKSKGYRIRVWNDEKTKSYNTVQYRNQSTSSKKR